MNARFSKWGNSLALRIPASFAQNLAVSEGAMVNMTIQDGKLIIEPIADPVYNLDELLDGIHEGNLHGEIKTHVAVGNEFAG